MSIITVYTDIDTLFDTRRGILEHMAREAGVKNFEWRMYEPFYKSRTLDYFEKPEFGITHAKFVERFGKRSVDDWVDDKYCYFYPSNIIYSILPSIRSIEFGSNQTIQASKIELTVNTYPFEMSDELEQQLLQHLNAVFKIKIDIGLVYIPFEKQTASYINGYNYVFRYGHLINPELKAWYDTYAQCKLVGTKIIVPDLLAKTPSNDPVFEALNKDSVKSRIEKMSALQGGRCVFIPLGKEVFDYIDSK